MAWSDPAKNMTEAEHTALLPTLVCWECGANNKTEPLIQLMPDGNAVCTMCDFAWTAWTPKS